MTVLSWSTIVDGDALWQTVWIAAAAGIGVCIIFACTILGATRSSDLRRAERPGPAALYGLIAALGLAGTAAIVVYGVVLITTK